MILVDYTKYLVSTESEEELHAFAGKLGLKRSWLQSKGYGIRHPHYDLTTPAIVAKAIEMGAEEVTPRDLVRRAWWGDGTDTE